MSKLAGKKILLGICGSIAAYKSIFFIRLLRKNGAEVRVIMTEAAKDFVTPLSLATLSDSPIYAEFFDKQSGVWNSHVELGLWADLMIIAPATAQTLAKMANGLCDNLLTATYLSARCPVYIAPAMDLDMWQHPATRRNLESLKQDGARLIPVGNGELASGLVGEGRMAEPEDLLSSIEHHFELSQCLTGKRVLISAGPTYEAIDPVRFIGNHSSGKMGIALADYAAELGADVHLVLGPSSHRPKNNNIIVEHVVSASAMKTAMDAQFPKADICIMSAAVADYRPSQVAENKIKKSGDTLTINLQKNEDILAGLGKQKRPGQLLIGFALETQNEEHYAREKLAKKNLDLIVMNSLNNKGAGFGVDTNNVLILDKNESSHQTGLATKDKIAEEIWSKILVYCPVQ